MKFWQCVSDNVEWFTLTVFLIVATILITTSISCYRVQIESDNKVKMERIRNHQEVWVPKDVQP